MTLTMPSRPPLADAPTVEDVREVSGGDPIATLRIITALAHDHGTLTAELAKARRIALHEAIAKGWTPTAITTETGLTLGRVCQMLAEPLPA